jgi:hypothetical protein
MELLALCVVPKATYEIMTKLKLSWDTVNASVKFLVYKGLLHTDVLKRRRKRDGRALSATPVYVEKKVYCTTDAGREVVRLWLEFQRKLNEKDLNTRLINPLTNNIIRE